MKNVKSSTRWTDGADKITLRGSRGLYIFLVPPTAYSRYRLGLKPEGSLSSNDGRAGEFPPMDEGSVARKGGNNDEAG
jgi:hypothetical protein